MHALYRVLALILAALSHASADYQQVIVLDLSPNCAREALVDGVAGTGEEDALPGVHQYTETDFQGRVCACGYEHILGKEEREGWGGRGDGEGEEGGSKEMRGGGEKVKGGRV